MPKARIAMGDSFQGFAGYRAALALHCAAEQGRWAQLHTLLATRLERGSIAELTEQATAAGLDAAAFRACLESDRYLPDIEENRLQAARLGIPAGDPGLFVDGVTIWDLDQPDKLAAQLEPLLKGTE